MPDLSIIVPVYNVEKYINKCLDSILNQKNVSFELIVVDDGSPDSCPDIIDNYSKKDSRVKVIHQTNAGVSNARNRGISEAQGEYLYFVDSDDWLVDDKLSKVLNIAKEKKLDVLFCDCYEAYESGQTKRLHLFSKRFVFNEKSNIDRVQKSILCHKYSPFFSAGADNAYPAPWSKLIKTSLIKENNIRFNPDVCGVYDDGLFTIEVLEKAKKIAYSGIATYYYRILDSSIVHSFRQGMVERFEKNCFAMNDFIAKNQKSEDFVDAEYARRIAYLSLFLTSYFFSKDNTNNKKKVKQELKATINRSPWREAIKKAKYSNLETKHKYTLLCMKCRFLFGLKTYTMAKRIIKKG